MVAADRREDEEKNVLWGCILDFYSKAINYTLTCFSGIAVKRKPDEAKRGWETAQDKMTYSLIQRGNLGSTVLMRFIKIVLDRFFIIN